MPIQALIFDLDDTLMPEHPADEAALAATLRPFVESEEVTDELLAKLVWKASRDNWLASPFLEYTETVGTSSLEQLWAPVDRSTPELSGLSDWSITFRETVWRGVAADLGLDPDSTWQMMDMGFQQERGVRHFSYGDVIPTLEALRGSYPMGLLTNGIPKVQRHKATAAGLIDYFDLVIVSGDHVTRKPDPLLFELMLAGLNVAAANAVVIGDRLATDIAGANAAGIKSIQVRRPGNSHAGGDEATPDHVITNLTELAALLE
ncbi:MAG: HAD family hydrolase [Chloroflexi bacterium]|nr:HAD family hydrolase [Chloroflexota bacterium]